jgi:hypothetical protein
LRYPWLAVGILVFGLAAEAVSLRACLTEVNKLRNGRSLWRWFRETRHSELVVVLGEDLAALFGLTLALVAVLATIVSGEPLWDAAGSIAIGVVLIVVAIGIAIEIKGLLIGQSAEPQTEARLREFLQARDEVEKVYRVLHAAARRLAHGRGEGAHEGKQRGRGGRRDQRGGKGAARRVSADPVAVLRARRRGLSYFFSSTMWKNTSSLRTMPSS